MQYLRGWAKRWSGFYQKKKERLLLSIDELDIRAESIPLSKAERVVKRNADDCLAKLRREELTMWSQRAKVKHMLEGGNNTKYVHLVEDGKHKKKNIFQLEHDEGTIVGEASLKVFIT
jgi:hypothetical protein